MAPTLQEIKEHLYLEHSLDDALLTSQLAIANAFVLASTGVDPDNSCNVLVKSAVMLHVSLQYAERNPISDKRKNAIPHALDSLLMLIKHGDIPATPCP